MTVPNRAPTVPGTLVQPPTVTVPRAPSLDGHGRHSREDPQSDPLNTTAPQARSNPPKGTGQ